MSTKVTDNITITLVIPTTFGIIGGYENLVYDLAECLKNKANVHVVCTDVCMRDNMSDEIKLFPILRIVKIRYLGFIVNLLLNYLIVLNYIWKERPDIVHAHPVFPSGFIALSAKLFKVPLVGTSHGDDILFNKEKGYGQRNNKIVAWFIKYTIEHLDLHTVVSKSMIPEALDAGSDIAKICAIYNGINLDHVGNHSQMDILHRHNIQNEDFIVLFMGRLCSVKCPGDVLEAFFKVAAHLSKAKLIFAGSGQEEMKLKKRVSELDLDDKVIFTGFVSPEIGKWDLMQRCNVFVLPSLVEAFGIALIEAMACGKPAIATNVGPFPEIIKDGETGYLVPINSPDDIARRILEIANNNDKARLMGEKARQYVNKYFSIDRIANQYFELYMESINSKGNSVHRC